MKKYATGLVTVFAVLICIKLSLPQESTPSQEDPNALVINGLSLLNKPGVSSMDKMRAREKARANAVYMVQGFDFQYMKAESKATILTQGKGDITTIKEASYSTLTVGKENLLLCRQEVRLDKKTAEARKKKLKETRTIAFTCHLTPREARLGGIKECILQALKGHFKDTKEKETIQGHGWLAEKMEIKKGTHEEKGEVLKISLTLHLPKVK